MGKERKKSVPKPIDVDAEVTKALLTIATAETSMRLVKKGAGYDAVFASDKTEKAKKVVEECQKAGKELVTVVGSGKEERVELTPAGLATVFDALLGSNPPARTLIRVLDEVMNSLPTVDRAEKLGGLAERAALRMSAESRIGYLRDESRLGLIPADRLDKLLRDAESEAAEERRESARKNKTADEEYLRCLEVAKQSKQREQQGEIDLLLDLLRIAGHKPATEHPASLPQPKLPMPANDEEKDFRRIYARRLVSAWHQAVKQGNTDGQRFLETALYNLDGIHVIGEPGEVVKFDPELHEPLHGSDVGDNITLTQSGWWLQEKAAKYILLRAVAE